MQMNGTCFACVKIERLFQADGPVTPPLWGQRGDAKQHRLCLSSLPPIGSVPYTLTPPHPFTLLHQRQQLPPTPPKLSFFPRCFFLSRSIKTTGDRSE